MTEIIITWGLISTVLVSLTYMQILSMNNSLDALLKTQYVLNLGSYGECFYDPRESIVETSMSLQQQRCINTISKPHNTSESAQTNVNFEIKNQRLSFWYEWHNSRLKKQKISVMLVL